MGGVETLGLCVDVGGDAGLQGQGRGGVWVEGAIGAIGETGFISGAIIIGRGGAPWGVSVWEDAE